MDVLLLKYFVLRPKGNDTHAKASRRAMLAYADVMETENPSFAHDIREWAYKEAGINIEKPE